MDSSEPHHIRVLRTELERRCRRNAGYSLRAFARDVGVDVSTLSKAMAGKKPIPYKAAARLAQALALTTSQRSAFLDSAADAQRACGLQRLHPDVRKRPPRPRPAELGTADFEAICDWYHFAILELTFVAGFVAEAGWVARRLGISELTAGLALERLERVGLLTRAEDGRVTKATSRLETPKGASSSGVRRHQRQVLDRAKTSLEQDPFETRVMRSLTLPADREQVALAAKLIDRFATELCERLASGRRNAVYQLHVAYFPLDRGSGTDKGGD
jgi:uncharacterized protein (TIGR02147 family)